MHCTRGHSRSTLRACVQMYQSEAVKRYEVARHAAFFTDAHARRMYMAHAAALLNRVNSYSGVQYRDDPTILGWCALVSSARGA